MKIRKPNKYSLLTCDKKFLCKKAISKPMNVSSFNLQYF